MVAEGAAPAAVPCTLAQPTRGVVLGVVAAAEAEIEVEVVVVAEVEEANVVVVVAASGPAVPLRRRVRPSLRREKTSSCALGPDA